MATRDWCRLTCLGSLLLVSACQQTDGYARSLLGETLAMPELDPEKRAHLTRNLDEARAAFERDPRSEDAIIWYGRRLAYLTRHREAIDVFTDGLRQHPESYRLLRHRGHRYISTRQLDRAIADFERAAELMPATPLRTEPDGAPNARNIPISTTQGNVWYHLGLARYLSGDLEGALAAYDRRFHDTDKNDDNICSTAYWRHIILTRLDRTDEAREALAKVSGSMNLLENFGYRDLCLLFRGDKSVDDMGADAADAVHTVDVTNATVAYGVSMYHYMKGEHDTARTLWRAIVDGQRATTAFGYIAAEAELARGPR